MGILAAFGLRVKKRPASTDPGDIADADEAERILASQGPALTDHRSDTNPIRSDYLTTRVLMGIVGTETAVIIMMTLAILEMVPLHTVQPFFVTFQDSTNQIVSIAPPTANITAMSIITSQYVREYMTMRYEVLPSREENDYRWKTRVKVLSAPSVYTSFENEIRNIPDLQQKQGMLRQIVIRSVVPMGAGTYHIDFDLIDHYNAVGIGDSPEKQTSWTAYMTVGFFPQTVPRSIMSLNPFGFKVTGYTVASRHS